MEEQMQEMIQEQLEYEYWLREKLNSLYAYNDDGFCDGFTKV